MNAGSRHSLPIAALFAAVALTAWASPAAGDHLLGTVQLRWDACYGGGGTSNRTFACDSNAGIETLVLSATPAVSMSQVNGASVVLEVLSVEAAQPDWWRMQTGGCRVGALGHSFVPPPGSTGCADPWHGMAAGGSVYNYPFSLADRGRIRAVMAIPGTTPVEGGIELFVVGITLSRTASLGTGACLGCASPMCIAVGSVTLTQPLGVGDLFMSREVPTTDSDLVTWQEGAVFRRTYSRCMVCTTESKDLLCLSVTDVRRPTWGAIKRLYR